MNKYYYEAPDRYPINLPPNSIFLAGSITGAWNWQEKAAEKLIEKYWIFNPRRSDYGICDETKLREQIAWEYHALRAVNRILFYFSHETVAPITLFEFGAALEREEQRLTICCHPDYPRKRDVEIQTRMRSSVKIYNDLDEAIKSLL
jgi:hypothetical protein